MATPLHHREIPAYPDPSNVTGAHDYVRSLHVYDESLRDRAADLLSAADIRQQVADITKVPAASIAFATTGSDGRGEKGPPSPLEVIVLLRCGAIDVATRGAIQTAMDPVVGLPLFDHRIEAKGLGSGRLVFHNDDGKQVWPSRATDAVAIDPQSADITEQWRSMTVHEIQNMKRAKVIGPHDDRLRYHRGISQAGQAVFGDRERTHFNMSEGVAHWSPESHQTAFKHGPLRLLQMRIARDCVTLCRRYAEPTPFMRGMPRPTGEKLRHLEGEGLLRSSEKEIDDVVRAYEELLLQTHKTQHNQIRNGSTTTPFDRSTIQEYVCRILEFTEKAIIKSD